MDSEAVPRRAGRVKNALDYVGAVLFCSRRASDVDPPARPGFYGICGRRQQSLAHARARGDWDEVFCTTAGRTGFA